MGTLHNTLVPGWESDPAVDRWIRKHQFGAATPFADAELRALSGRRKRKPAGLYVWEGEKHEIYVGISNSSVTTRLRAHDANYGGFNIQSFRYWPHSGDSTALRKIERDLIYDAVDSGFTVVNREHSAIIYGDSVFDDKVSLARQKRWFTDPLAYTVKPRREIDRSQEAKARERFREFSARSDADQIVRALGLYLRACTPFPAETEEEYWSLTCLPSTKGRVVTLNMGYLEMLWIYEPDRSRHPKVRIGTDYLQLPGGFDRLVLRTQGVKRVGPLHRIGGPNEEVVEFSSVDTFVTGMLKSEGLRQGASRFALDRMRKGRVSGRYRDAHNALLADAALHEAARRPASDFRRESTS